MSKKKSSGWKTHKKGVKALERVLGVPMKKTGRKGEYLVELPSDHPISKKLEQQ